MKKPTAIVFVDGGTIPHIYVNDEKIQVFIVDLYTEGLPDRELTKSANGVPVYANSFMPIFNPEEVKYWRRKILRREK